MSFNPRFLKSAFKEAQKAASEDEVPVGAIIVLDGKIVARGRNLRETKQTVLGHAELVAIKKAEKKLGSWRLEKCEMYVTLEPCQMCVGALKQARIKTVYYGAKDIKKVNFGTSLEYVETSECSKILSDFFKKKRVQK